VIGLATALGLALNFLGINPMRALYYAAVLNGVIAPPLMIMIMHIGGSAKIMKDRTNKGWTKAVGWTATGIMTVAALALAFQLLMGHGAH
jgi:Mn2+/Fe2+ NRAMP family transporter